MLKKFTLPTLLLLSVFVKAQTLDMALFKKNTAQELRDDVDTLRQQLILKHPKPYWYISKSNLDKKFDSLKATIKSPLTRAQFRHSLACVLSAIGDGHLTVNLNDKLSADYVQTLLNKTFPLQHFDFKVLNNKLYIIKDKSGLSLAKPGSQVVAIDGRNAKDIIRELRAGISADGYNQLFKDAYLSFGGFAISYIGRYGTQDSMKITVETEGQNRSFICTSGNHPALPNDIELKNRVLMQYQDNGNYAFLKIGSLQTNVEDPYRSVFEQMKISKTPVLVLDLRDNLGGNETLMLKLFSYLIDKPTYFSKKSEKQVISTEEAAHFAFNGSVSPIVPSDVHFSGKLYVLINSSSFSAASLVAANLQANKLATFVGEETGGGRNGCIGGSFSTIVTPNSKLAITIGSHALEITDPSPIAGRGVIPDYPITYTVDDYVLQKDVAYQWLVQNLLQKK